MPNETTLKLTVSQIVPESVEETVNFIHSLRNEILETDIISATLSGEGKIPANSRGDANSVTTILVALATTGGILPSLISAIQSYLSRNEKHNVIVEDESGKKITLTGHSTKEEKEIIQNWVHAKKE